MNNPYTLARKELSLTQQELSDKAGVSAQVITNLERGLFYKPPSNVVRALHEAYQDRYIWWNAPRQAQLYIQWVREQRAINGDKFPKIDTLTSEDSLTPLWDWVDFRHSVHKSFRGFCRALVFQPSMLAEFEDRGLNKDAVRRALREVGYSEVAADIIVAKRRDNVRAG